MQKVLVVLSGGQDSTTCLFHALASQGVEVHAITFDYGQRHRAEIEAAIKVADIAGIKSHDIVNVSGLLESTSPLTSDAELEQYESAKQMDEVIGNRIEKTFVPMRNVLFFTIAMNRAVTLGCDRIYTGICQEDNANYPDCTEKFRGRFEVMTNHALGTATGGKYYGVVAPLMNKSKAETVQLMHNLGDTAWRALAHTHTSYDGKYPPTDMNHANVLRAQGFEEAGLPDPLVVRAWAEGFMDLPDTPNYDDIRQEDAMDAGTRENYREWLNFEASYEELWPGTDENTDIEPDTNGAA